MTPAKYNIYLTPCMTDLYLIPEKITIFISIAYSFLNLFGAIFPKNFIYKNLHIIIEDENCFDYAIQKVTFSGN